MITTESTNPATSAVEAAPPPPPVPHRRPRVREVSSRFMSPLNSTTSSAQNRSKSARDDHALLSSRGENENLHDTIRRSLDTPKSVLVSSINRKHQPKSRQKLFKENGEPQKKSFDFDQKGSQSLIRSSVDGRECRSFDFEQKGSQNLREKKSFDFEQKGFQSLREKRSFDFEQKGSQTLIRSSIDGREYKNFDFEQKGSQSLVRSSVSRSDTPSLNGNNDRIVQSRYRVQTNQLQRSFSGISAAEKLLQEATGGDDMVVLGSRLKKVGIGAGEEESGEQPRSCPNSPICVSSNKLKINGGDCESLRLSQSTCSRSLDFRNGDSNRSVLKMGVLPLPPHPKLGSLDSRRGKKGGQQEDAHLLKLMHNHLLQWRFANAKAETSMQAQKTEAERQLYSLGSNIAGLRDSVERKRIELARLQRITTLSTIFEGQMPDLDKWSNFEEDYSSSLSGITNALLNTFIRLPVGGEIRPVDVTELRDVLDSACNVMETMGSHIQRFIPKAEEADASSSELARMVAEEKSLVEESGNLVSKMQVSQINEWSLRGHLIQINGTKTSTSV